MKEVLEEISLKKIAGGNLSACRYIVDKYKDYVFNIAMKICKNKNDAEEVTQDSFMKAFDNLKNFKYNAKFSTWLYRIAYNTAISHSRKFRFFSVPVDENTDNQMLFNPVDSIWEQYAKQEKISIMTQAIEQLSDDETLLINLYYHHDHTFAEISDITGLTVDNIKVRMFRIRRKLLDWLKFNLKDEIKDM